MSLFFKFSPVNQSPSKRFGSSKPQPYPKWVYSPAGGWNSQPKNWKTNTAITLAGIAFFCYFVFQFSAEHEIRTEPNRWIPSMLWSKHLKEMEARKKLLQQQQQQEQGQREQGKKET